MRKVVPGQKNKLRASTVNSMLDAAQDYRDRNQALLSGDNSVKEALHGILLVRNDTGADLDIFTAIGISTILFTPDTGADHRQYTYSGITPTGTTSNFGVTQEPIKAGAFGRAMITGVTPCQIARASGDISAIVGLSSGKSYLVTGVPGGQIISEDISGDTTQPHRALINLISLGGITGNNVSVTIDGGGAAISSSNPSMGGATVVIPAACNIMGWVVEGDAIGSIVVDVKRANAAVPSTSIVGTGNKPTLSSAQYAAAAPSGWASAALAANDVIGFAVSSATTVQRVTVTLMLSGSTVGLPGPTGPTGPSGGVSSVSGTAPISSSGGATPAISIADATATVRGAVPTPPNDATKVFLGNATFGAPPSSAPSGAAGGDLTGTYPNPTLATARALTSRLINTTAPITGGGDLSADRTIAISDATATTRGAVPTPPNDATKVLRGDMTYNQVTNAMLAGSIAYSKLSLANSIANSDLIAQIDIFNKAILVETNVTGTATLGIQTTNVCSGTTSDYTATLPAVSGNTGKLIQVRIDPACTKLITIKGNGAEIIDGSNTRVMWANESALLYCNGSAWTKISGKTIPMYSTMTISATPTIGTGVATKLALDTTVADNAGMADAATNHRIKVRRAGVYRISAQFYSSAIVTANGRFLVTINKNGSAFLQAEQFGGVGLFAVPSTNSMVALAAADTLELFTFQNTGVNQGTNASSSLLLAEEVIAW